MTAIEQQILEKLRALDSGQQQQVLDFIQAMQPSEFDHDRWSEEVMNFRKSLRRQFVEELTMSPQSLLDGTPR